jgi:DNA-binding NtrC family response regulator/ligand-binding sensor domain-containing protein
MREDYLHKPISPEMEKLFPFGDLPPLPRNGTWRKFTTVDGLASPRAEHVIQDGSGDIWIGTATGGVSRFDGETWQTYTRVDGLSGNQVPALELGKDGRLWLGTYDGGLCWWDGTGFQHPAGNEIVSRSVSHLLADESGRIWFAGQENLGFYEGDDWVDLLPLYKSCYAVDLRTCWGIARDGRGCVWFGTNLGLLGYEDGALRLEFPTEEPKMDIPPAVGEDGRGGIWVSSGGRLWRGDGESFAPIFELVEEEECRKIQIDREGRPWFLLQTAYYADSRGMQHLTIEGEVPSLNLSGMVQDQDGRFWLASWIAGVYCYDPHTIQICLPRGGKKNPRQTAGLLCARDGRVWLGNLHGDEREAVGFWNGERFKPFDEAADQGFGKCFSLAEGSDGSVYLGTDGGLLRWDGDHLWRIELPEGEWIERTFALCANPDGGIFCAVSDIPSRKREIFQCDSEGFRSRFEIPLEDWVASGSGDWEYQLVINRLVVDGEKRLWVAVSERYGIGQSGGLLCLDGEIHSYTSANGLPDNRVQDLSIDRDGRLWIATFGGLSCFDGESFRNYTTADGLVSNCVLCLCHDAKDRLWCGTEAGLAVFDGQIFQAVRSAHIGPTRRMAVDREGWLWCATYDNGTIRYAPGDQPPQVEVTRVNAGRVYEHPESIQVPSSTPQVVFEYRGSNRLPVPEQLRYRCRLRGWEREWRPAAEMMRAVYEALSEGEYTFEVQAIDASLNYSRIAQVRLKVVPDPHLAALQEALSEGAEGEQFVGESPAVLKLKGEIAEAAFTDLPVLILGETGTGKGIGARMVHRLSPRRDGPFVHISCGAIPDGLVESELFGHEQGAFTGAQARKLGKVELAAGGTLFLDEIGDMPLEAEVKLLRLLEEGHFERVGGTETLTNRARVVAATNRDLEKMVAAETFRADLFFRLAGFTLRLPPLRDRKEDIPLLADYFAGGMAAHLNRTRPRVSEEALRVLGEHDWPGNVRELEHVVRRSVVVCRGGVMQAGDLGFEEKNARALGGGVLVSLEEMERQYIMEVLEQTGWVIDGPKGAAVILELKPPTLRFRMKKLGIVRP